MTPKPFDQLMFQMSQLTKWLGGLLQLGARHPAPPSANLPVSSLGSAGGLAAAAQLRLAPAAPAVPQSATEYQARLLAELGLASALQSEINLQTWPGQPSQASLQISTGSVLQRLPQPVEAAAFWIAREALSNALNPIHATRVLLSLDIQKTSLRMEVHDIGHGLLGTPQPHAGAAKRHNAGAWPRDLDQHPSVVAMRLRANAVGARLTLRSDPLLGTRVILRWLPVLPPVHLATPAQSQSQSQTQTQSQRKHPERTSA